MTARHTATRSQYVLLGAQVVRLVVSLAIAALLGRHLPAEDFGLVALVSTIFLIAQEVLDMGTASLACREVVRDPSRERSILTALLGWRRLFSLPLAALVAVLVLGPFGLGDRPLLAAAIVCGVCLLHYSAYHVVFQVRQAFEGAVALGLALQFLFLVACIAALGLASTGAVIAFLVVARETAQVFGSRWLARRLLGYRLETTWFDRAWMPLLRAAWVFGFAGVLYKLSINAGGFFVWTLASPEALGTYNAAQRIVSPLRDVAWLFCTPLIATMSVGVVTDPGSVQAHLDRYVCLLTGVAAAVGVCGIVLAPTLLRLLYGSRYADGSLSALAPLQWQVVAACIAVVTPLLIVGKLAFGRERELMVKSFACLVGAGVAHALVVPRWGATGASAVTAATEAAVLVMLWTPMAFARQARLLLRLAGYALPAVVVAAGLAMLAAWPAAQFVAGCLLAALVLVVLWGLPEQRAGRADLKSAEVALRAAAVESFAGGST